MNSFEHLARSAKVLRLTAAINDAVRTVGIPADKVGPELAGWSREVWASVARSCGVNPPSPTTIRAVLAQYGEAR